MAFMDDHEAYQKHKDDPLVLMLLEFFRSGNGIKIPPVWKSFIMKSTKETDINLLLSQLHVWGISEEIDLDLRGGELLDNIMGSRLRMVCALADKLVTKKKIPWPLALEEAFISKGLILPAEQRKLTSKGKVMFNCNLNYVETGTIRYQVRRSIPEIMCLIPPEWILEHCHPAISDADIMASFHGWMQHGFCPKEIRRRGGFDYKGWLNKVLGHNDPGRWNPVHLRSSLRRMFPKTVQGASWDDESSFNLELIEAKVNPLTDDTEIGRRNIRLELRKDRRHAPRPTHMQFPVFDPYEVGEMEENGVRIPSAETVTNSRLQYYYDDPRSDVGQEAMDDCVSGLRRVYEQLRKSTAYDELRRQTLGK